MKKFFLNLLYSFSLLVDLCLTSIPRSGRIKKNPIFYLHCFPSLELSSVSPFFHQFLLISVVCLSIPSFVLLSLYFVLFFSSFTSVFVPPIPYPLYFLYLSIVLYNQFQLSTKCPSFPKITDCPTVSFHLIPFLPFISLDHQMSHRSFHLIIKCPIIHFT